MKTIVKIQIPLSSNSPNPEALVYNKDRSFHIFMAIDQVKDLFKAGEVKIYMHAELKQGDLHLGERAPEQDW